MTEPDSPDTAPDHAQGVPPEETVAVVGIGASAGGLAALRRLLEALPADTGMAFVVVTHLDPTRESVLHEILQQYTPMPVCQVHQRLKVEPNSVYVIPPARRIVLTDTHLDTAAFEEPRGQRRPIDFFFRSLAQGRQDAIAVILSGSGTDGAVGVKSIKEQGGLLLVQDPQEAEYDGMPRAAIATGLADLVLPVEELATHLARYRHQPRHVPRAAGQLSAHEADLLQRILTQVQVQTGHDFRQYKRSTVLRRIQRRMQLFGHHTLEAYLLFLHHTPHEAPALFNDLLIGVTNFFRDRESWEALAEQVIPKLFEGKEPADSVRAWTIGCATGEEAYTLAILLLEHAATLEDGVRPLDLQVFASDLDEAALARARDGVYPAAIEADVSAERLARFFNKQDEHYRVKRELRDMVLFSNHSVLRDPPFSRLALISCRNLLIYLHRPVQEDVFETFHYALDPDGYLFLGNAEAVDAQAGLFRTLDKASRLYQRLPDSGDRPLVPSLPLAVRRAPRPAGGDPLVRPATPTSAANLARLHVLALEEASPPSVLVDASHQVLHLSETVGRYLQSPGGPPTRDLTQLVRRELQDELRLALFGAFDSGKNVLSAPVPVHFNGHPRHVALAVRPRAAQAGTPEERVALVLFLEHELDQPLAGTPLPAGESRTQEAELVAQAQREAQRLRERLRATSEAYESSVEELKAANEELQSLNEEYRSTTEELETSKEELQSLNEELQTVNTELKHKLEEVSRAHSDLENLMTSTEIATLFLDRELAIQRYTPGVMDLFHIRAGDRGRPVADLMRQIDYPALDEDAREVLGTLIPIEREVAGTPGRHFLVRVRPYRSVEDRIEGVVITFVDISARKEAEEALRAARVYAESIIETLHEPLLVLTPDLRVRSANPAFFTHFQVQPSQTIGRLIYELGNGQWDIPALRALLEDVLPDSNVFNDYEVTHDFEEIGERVMLVNARRLDSVQLILLGIRDVTQRQRAETVLRQSAEQLHRMINVEGVGVLVLDEGGTLLDANDAFLDMHGYRREEVESGTMTWRDLTPPEYVAESERQMQKLATTGRIGPYEKEYLRKDGSRAWMLFAGASLGNGTSVKYCIDVSDRKRAEDALRASEARFRDLTNTLPALVWTTDAQGQPTYFNAGWLAYTGQSEAEAFTSGAAPVIHPDDYERARARWRAAAAAEETFEIEYRLRRSGGVYEWHVARAAPVVDAEGAIVEWVGSAINVQAQREAEAAVRASEERYRVLVESAREYAILLLDRRGQITMWSRGAERIFGYTPADAIGQHGALIFTAEDRAAGVPEREIEVAAETGLADDERWHRRKDGSRFWASGVMQALHDDAGQLRGFTKVLRDNTTRKQAEEALRQSEERFRQVVEAVPDIVFTATPDGVIDYVSPRRQELTGQPEENALGTRLWPEIIHPDDRPQAMAGWEEAIARQAPCVLRHRLQMAGGAYRWVIVRARPVLDGNNEVYRWFGTVSDVDALTRAEEGLRRLNETLEVRVATRTAQVEELAIALTLAEQTERQRVSHVLHDDLQQRLYSQLMRLQMAHQQPPGQDEERLAAALEQVMAELKQAIQVTRTLVTELSPPVLHNEGLPEALSWLSTHINQLYGLEVEVKIREHCEPTSEAMRSLLVQMTRELLFNVVKHAATAQAEVILDRDGESLHLSVQDRGTGFDRAAVLAAPAARRGFGLTSISQRLELMGGRARVDSTPGQGTRITLIAPCGGGLASRSTDT